MNPTKYSIGIALRVIGWYLHTEGVQSVPEAKQAFNIVYRIIERTSLTVGSTPESIKITAMRA